MLYTYYYGVEELHNRMSFTRRGGEKDMVRHLTILALCDETLQFVN